MGRVDQSFDDAGFFVIDELFELLQRIDFFLFVAVVYLFESGFELLAEVDEANFGGVEQEEQVELFAFSETDLVVFVNLHNFNYIAQLFVAVAFQFGHSAQASGEILPHFPPRLNVAHDCGLYVYSNFLEFEQKL